MTIDDLFEYYRELKQHSITKHTLHSNTCSYSKHIAPVFGNREIDTIAYLEYQKFANKLLDTKKPKTVKNILSILQSLYTLANKLDVYNGSNVVKFVELPRFDNRRYFTLSVELQKRYIKAILNFDEPIYRDIFLFLLHGRRLSEVLNLRWEFIDLNNGIMYLPATQNKSKKNLSFELTNILINRLNLLVDRNKALMRGYIFINPKTDKPFIDVRRAFKRLLELNKLPKIRIHDIRHLVATYSINTLNLSVEYVSHTLGHTDIKTTQRYINPNPANAKKVIDSVIESVS